MPTRDDRGRPTANWAASNVISDGDVPDSTATEDRFCCTSLTIDERMIGDPSVPEGHEAPPGRQATS